MTDTEKMKIEADRVRALLADAVAGVEADGGDIRFFNAAFLTVAIQLHAEVEGFASVESAITKIAKHHMIASGAAGRS